MSAPRRLRSASVDNIASRRFFSRITVWDFWALLQRLGSAACLSTSANWSRSLPASKILLKVAYFLFQRGVFLFQIFDHYDFVLGRKIKLHNSAATEIIAHTHANQSPCRV